MRERQIPFMGIDIEVYRALRPLLTTEQVGEVIDALIDYAQDDEYKPSFDDQAARAFFAILASKVENSITKYNEKCEKNRKNANKAKNKTINNDVSNTRSDGERPQAMASDGEQPLPNVTNVTPSVTQSVTPSVIPSVTPSEGEFNLSLQPHLDRRKTEEREIPRPTFAEVEEYANNIGLAVDARRFVLTNEMNGWKDSNGNPIRDWRVWMVGWAKLNNWRGGNVNGIDKGRTEQADVSGTVGPGELEI